jgi:hypothetical protein
MISINTSLLTGSSGARGLSHAKRTCPLLALHLVQGLLPHAKRRCSLLALHALCIININYSAITALVRHFLSSVHGAASAQSSHGALGHCPSACCARADLSPKP